MSYTYDELGRLVEIRSADDQVVLPDAVVQSTMHRVRTTGLGDSTYDKEDDLRCSIKCDIHSGRVLGGQLLYNMLIAFRSFL